MIIDTGVQVRRMKDENCLSLHEKDGFESFFSVECIIYCTLFVDLCNFIYLCARF